ncbi:hypothetical protein C367_02091 [Cryptococcus neoformans Ze90-1]|nr:hypothetical protein C367_02091 [Cryptococcus neoformans var. grubii Ze90-1]
MSLPDAVKIALAVISPVLFFSLLFIAVFLYRHYLSPYRKHAFRPEDQVWNPTVREFVLPRCHLCYRYHQQHDQENGLMVSVDNEIPSLRNTNVQTGNADERGNISQPHFLDRIINVRKLSRNPYLPDVVTRVQSVTSTMSIQIQKPAKASSEVLAFGGGHRASHASTLNPNLLGCQGVKANSIAEGVIAVGDRRPSVLSGGLSDKKGNDKLPLRKISAGGKEELIQINAASIDSSGLPVKKTASSSDGRPSISRQPSFKSDRLDKRNTYQEWPSAHPVSPAELRANATVPHGSIIPPIPHILTIQAPLCSHKKDHQKRQRPDSLKLASATLQRKANGPHNLITAPTAGLTTSVSMLAMKSAPLAISPETDRINLDSATASEDQYESGPTPGLFEAWKGFPSKATTAKAAIIKAPRHEPSKITIPPQPDMASVSHLTVQSASATGRLHPSPGPSLTIQVSPMGSERFSTEHCTSKITYLADVVKENEAKRKSATPIPLPLATERPKRIREQLVPPNTERRLSLVGSYPPIISPFPFQGQKTMEEIQDKHDDGHTL